MTNINAFFLEHGVSIAGAVIGLLYLYLEYKANVWMWAAGIAMSAFYIWIFYATHLYASMGIYIYFFAASIYGWIMWILKNRDKETGEDIITRMQKNKIPIILIGIIFVGITIFLILIKNDTYRGYITIGDSLTTSLNIVALWMISRKWAEQWLLLIPANALSGLLLFAQDDITSGILFMVFFIVSIFGYINWKRMANSNINEKQAEEHS